jgi:hypothetical protein
LGEWGVYLEWTKDNYLLSGVLWELVFMCFKEALDNANAILRKYYYSLDVVLVAHVLEPRGHDNLMQLNCSETEHFTLQEFDEIYKGIIDAGFFIICMAALFNPF